MKVFVIKGGVSVEREISLNSGKNFEKALKELELPFWTYDLESFDQITNMIETIKKFKPQIILNALHGKFGEDGKIQAILDTINIPYTSSSMLASALAMDKIKSKLLFDIAQIPTPIWSPSTFDSLLRLQPIEYPFMIKPISEGSSFGVSLIKNYNDIVLAHKKWKYGDNLLVEKYMQGREIHVTCINGKPIGTVEITPKEEFYNYKSKYTKGMSQYTSPAYLEQDSIGTLYQYAEKAFNIIGCSGIIRCDFIYSEGEFYLLEINTQPGFSDTSLVPLTCKNLGWSFADIVRVMIESALVNTDIKKTQKDIKFVKI